MLSRGALEAYHFPLGRFLFVINAGEKRKRTDNGASQCPSFTRASGFFSFPAGRRRASSERLRDADGCAVHLPRLPVVLHLPPLFPEAIALFSPLHPPSCLPSGQNLSGCALRAGHPPGALLLRREGGRGGA